jgi:ubiquitin C-terminal hydrolase
MAISSWYKQHLFQKQQRSEATSRSSSGRGFWSSLFANDEETNKAAHMLEALAELWEDVSSTKRQMDRVEPRRFINTLRAQNMLFRSHAQQDAHEFLFFLLNDIGETLDAAAKKQAVDAGLSPPPKSESFVQTLFQGKLVTTTQCLTCEVLASCRLVHDAH